MPDTFFSYPSLAQSTTFVKIWRFNSMFITSPHLLLEIYAGFLAQFPGDNIVKDNCECTKLPLFHSTYLWPKAFV
jgi:hypothetical protein